MERQIQTKKLFQLIALKKGAGLFGKAFEEESFSFLSFFSLVLRLLFGRQRQHPLALPYISSAAASVFSYRVTVGMFIRK